MTVHEFQIIGRRKPTPGKPRPTIFRMRIFAPNDVIAKSRFWYFMKSLQRMKRVNGEILQINEIFEKRPVQVKNYQVALRYSSRTNEHNIIKEYRDVTRCGAVGQLINDMAGRHRTNFRRLQIMEVKTVTSSEQKRQDLGIKPASAAIKPFFNSKLKFPLAHRALKVNRKYAGIFKARRTSTHFG